MAKKEVKKDNKQQKSSYFKGMKAELKKVVWPTPKQLASNTAAVIVFTVCIALIVFVLDICFDSLNKKVVTPLQGKIQSSYHASHPSENTTNSTDGNTTNTENTESNATNSVETENTQSNTNANSENAEQNDTGNNSENTENGQ